MTSNRWVSQWATSWWRLLLILRNPILVVRRLWNGASFFTEVPLEEISRFLSVDSVIVEAGAADGLDTQKLASLVPRGTVYAFEPFAPMFRQLTLNTKSFTNIVCEPYALGVADGSEPFFASLRDGNSGESGSLLEPSQHQRFYPDIQFSIADTVDCVNLDNYFGQSARTFPDFAWLDLQGMELEVLRSSPNVREGLRAIWTEVCRVPLYRGAPTYGEVKRTLRGWGFVVAIDRVGAVAGNILFVKTDSSLRLQQE